jgi:hypothetical protein
MSGKFSMEHIHFPGRGELTGNQTYIQTIEIQDDLTTYNISTNCITLVQTV